ncbi:hypothetical protein M431DRAFT_508557 [Trichoderma harzianum CBS 226.95]|uniref:Uncharacterized protein n=1 Tax=Trichoderma harzianum CBS 226.95 TaxID=983964 RepID=A0A2T4ADI9_TRIHA|nr:hypothetical protein M431DRAFT_508557 [Trichoderma harzianum CBS 226.95]PTB55150.1 hypothetical protein M431DRAFT_508557 [Trichoderma harzianum CBS 226.95]
MRKGNGNSRDRITQSDEGEEEPCCVIHLVHVISPSLKLSRRLVRYYAAAEGPC